jgi:molybdopterin/thiamine biosynthesis adenylyltransferase
VNTAPTRVLRIENTVLAELEAELPLAAPGGVETAALAFGRVVESHGRRVFVVDGILKVPAGAYETREVARLRPGDGQILALASRLRGRGTFAVLAHTHPQGPNRHSSADDDYELKIATVLAGAAAGASLVSLLRHPGGWTSREVAAGGFHSIATGWVVGRPLRRLSLGREAEGDPLRDEVWARQALALGPHSPVDLRALRVGLVGAGGLGQILGNGLVRHGVGSSIVVDFDTIDATNISRLPLALASDIGALKVDVLGRLRDVHEAVEIATLAARVEEPEAQRALETCDVIVAATDNHTSRYVSWEIARRARAMFMSTGTDPRLGPEGVVARVSAYVADLLPTDGCPACNAVINPNQMRQEALPAETLENERRDGYIAGVERPAVLSWNEIAAGEAMARLLELVVGFGPAFRRGQVRRFELLAPPDTRYSAHAVQTSASGCSCALKPAPELRELMTSPLTAVTL